MSRPPFRLDAGTGLLFGRSSSNPAAPVISGDICTPDGQLLTIALFKRDKVTKSGEPMYGCKIETKEAADQRRAEAPRPAPAPTYRDRDTYVPPAAPAVQTSAYGPDDLVRADFGGGRSGVCPAAVAWANGYRILGDAR